MCTYITYLDLHVEELHGNTFGCGEKLLKFPWNPLATNTTIFITMLIHLKILLE